MQSGDGIGYGLKYQARCIASVKADSDHTSFLAGTLSLKEENEVHLIQLSSSGTELNCEGLFYHPHEIWDLSPCPFNPRIFSTVFASGGTYGACIWEMPEMHGHSNTPQLEQLISLDEHTCRIKCILWWPLGKHDKLVSIDEGNLFLWSLDSSTKSAKNRLTSKYKFIWRDPVAVLGEICPSPFSATSRRACYFSVGGPPVQSQESVGMLHYLSGGAWDPHDQNAIATTSESSVQCWDLRSMKKTNSIEQAHVRNADYNPKKQHILATAEDESGIHAWDLRMPKFPILELPGHAHWTWSAQHNPEYDELILSAGTDSAVNLWLASATSSEESTPESFMESPTRQADPLLHSYSDYEDSVYGLAWSSREPWIFASLSYDGRVVVESVKQYIPKR